MISVAYRSELLAADISVELELDAEPAEYQFGVLYGECYINEVRLNGVEIGAHLTDAALAVIRDEAEAEYLMVQA